MASTSSRHPVRSILVPLLLGAGFAGILGQAWDLEVRWLVVIAIGILGIAVSMCFASVFDDFVLVSSMFALPLFAFGKSFWIESLTEEEAGNILFSGTFGISPLDILMVMQYANWLFRIFVTRTAPLPRLDLLDLFVAWFLLANLVAGIGARQPIYSLGTLVFLTRYALFYFYLSRNIRVRHLPWLMIAFASTITLETLLGSVQVITGKFLGIALDKGAGGDALAYQYAVPGTEGTNRATGTCYDSHSLGLLMGMLLPFQVVLAVTNWVRPKLRICFAALALACVVIIFATLSRSAWVASAAAMLLGIVLLWWLWGETRIVPRVALAAAAVIATTPVTLAPIYERFANSPAGTLTSRYDTYALGLRVWGEHIFFGYGPGNWLVALRELDYLWQDILVVHNVLLWTASETGLFGLIGFLGIVFVPMGRFYVMARERADLVGRMSLAALLALVTVLLNGMTDPTLRDPNTFALFWLLNALCVAFKAMPADIGAFLAAPQVAGPTSRLAVQTGI